MRILPWLISICAVLLGQANAFGFALLGPYKPWMAYAIGYRQESDIGGPMSLWEGYRWNVPTITYGFDREFLGYFGERGVQAVEEAIGLLNSLPAASEIQPNQYVLDCRRMNYQAEAMNCMDITSVALGLLLEQLGLGEPTRFTWTIRYRQAFETYTNYAILLQNYDPIKLFPSFFVNGIRLAYAILTIRAGVEDAVEGPFFAWDFMQPAVADKPAQPGIFLLNLTPDDVGGLRYLLRRENWNMETVLPGISAVGPDPTNFVNLAARPGVEKITFVRHPWDTNLARFSPWTNVFVETVNANGVEFQQTLQRTMTEPDILFTAKDLGLRFVESGGQTSFWAPLYERSDTSHWINNSIFANPDYGGPGLIAPPVRIEFNKLGKYTSAHLGPTNCCAIPDWASFDGTTNAPLVYRGDETVSSVTVSARATGAGINAQFEWQLLGTLNAVYHLEATSDLADWQTVATLTNVSGFFTFTNSMVPDRRFYRAIRE